MQSAYIIPQIVIPVKRELLVAGGWAGGRALAELCGLSVNTVSLVERGKTSVPELEAAA